MVPTGDSLDQPMSSRNRRGAGRCPGPPCCPQPLVPTGPYIHATGTTHILSFGAAPCHFSVKLFLHLSCRSLTFQFILLAPAAWHCRACLLHLSPHELTGCGQCLLHKWTLKEWTNRHGVISGNVHRTCPQLQVRCLAHSFLSLAHRSYPQMCSWLLPWQPGVSLMPKAWDGKTRTSEGLSSVAFFFSL